MSTSVEISDVTRIREQSWFASLLANQALWVTVAVALICIATAIEQPDSFATKNNFHNITRNFAAIGIIAMGMTAVIITGGIDLSVGSVMALSAIVAARLLESGFDWYVGVAGGLMAGLVVGAINGALIAHIKLPPFVVTLGMLSIARSLAIVASDNRVIYQFGEGGDTFKWLGGGRLDLPWIDGDVLPLSNMFVVLVVMAVIMSIVLRTTSWGRYLFAIGGNEHAARLTGIPVDRIKIQVYMLAGFTAAIAGILSAGYGGSASNGMGKTYELYVIAATVIGGANLMGGKGSIYGAFIGAALIFLIRNSLIMFGVDANWYDLFVGLFIILAVLLERLRGRTRG
ncbi:MAG: ABC transporter permease [Geminicoccaceae bacterium]|jgi:ribose transport system permease protein|nr:ABC transporter permease [Geminicoccaceae bacterium]HRY27353.1 ABC transporter permease [Geminicoccaceae bacterium]